MEYSCRDIIVNETHNHLDLCPIFITFEVIKACNVTIATDVIGSYCVYV